MENLDEHGDHELFEEISLNEENSLSSLVSDWFWFDTGSALYKCAIALSTSRRSSTKYVGKAIAGMVGEDWINAGYQRVEEMLYGMAVEAWLKGLIVYAVPFNKEAKTELDRFLDEHVPTNELGLVEVSAILEVLETGPAKEIMQRVDATKSADERLRLSKLQLTHNLVKLAEIAELPALDQCEIDYLKYLETMIFAGRYPTTWKSGTKNIVIANKSTEHVRNCLFEKIHVRHDEIQYSGGGGVSNA